MTPLVGDDAHIRQRLIEISMVFGAQRFIFYNITTHSDSPAMDAIQYYKKRGLLTIMQWPWPFNLTSDTQCDGQTGAYMECMLRNLYSSQYVAYFDIDEMLVPRSVDNWSDLFALPEVSTSCGLQFRNTFFYTSHEDDAKVSSDSLVKSPTHSIYTLLKTRRCMKVWSPGIRSKYIAVTRNVRLPQTHIMRCNDGKITVLSSKYGLLHHYRKDNEPGSR